MNIAYRFFSVLMSFLTVICSVAYSDNLTDDIDIDIEYSSEESTEEDDIKDITITKRKLAGVEQISVNSYYKDSLSDKTDIKLYEFTLQSRAGVSVEFSHSTGEENVLNGWYFYLYERYDTDGTGTNYGYRLINKYEAREESLASVTNYNGLYPGEYIFAVTSGSGFTTNGFIFKLIADYTNIYEAEPNDNPYFYSEIRKDVTVKGLSNRKGTLDEDWYLFTQTDYGSVNISFERLRSDLPQVCWFIGLYDEDLNCLFYTSCYGTDTINTSGDIGLSPGNYLVVVKTHTNNDVQYRLTVNTGCVNEVEFNDTAENAEEFEFIEGAAVKTGSLSERKGSYDVDYYTFDYPSDGVFTLMFDHDALGKTDAGWRITVFDDEDNILYCDTSLWNESTKVAPLMGIDAGRYYIKIDADSLRYNSATYTLKLNFVETDTYETEPNNSLETADEIIDGSISGTLVTKGLDFDTDYYYFDVDKRTYIYVSFSHINLASQNEGWVITVTDEDGDEIESFTSKWVDTKRMSKLLVLDKGRYYITVKTGLYFSGKRYTLTLEDASN